jgi:hypothetical protein
MRPLPEQGPQKEISNIMTPRTRTRKYLGMTSKQVIMLSVVALFNCAILIVGMLLLLDRQEPIPLAVVNSQTQRINPLKLTPTRTLPPTWTPTSTFTPKPTRTPQPTYTPSAIPTARPTKTPIATATKPVSRALSTYIKVVAPLANKISGLFPGDSNTPSEQYKKSAVSILDQLDAMVVPKEAKLMHTALALFTSEVALFHLHREQALQFPDQFDAHMAASKNYGEAALSDYYQKYLPARNSLLELIGVSPQDAGFTD